MQIIGQICTFEAPFGGLGATYDVHLRLIGKLIGDFLLVIIELFLLGAFVLSQYTRLTDGQTDRISTAIPCVYASHSRTVKIVQISWSYSKRYSVAPFNLAHPVYS